MKNYVNLDDVLPIEYDQYTYLPLLDEKNGCKAGCRTGILRYKQMVYNQGGIHDDQEIFFVLKGEGSALIDTEEITLSPGVCFVVPPGKYHSIKKNFTCDFIELYFFHAAV
jgi:glyoxylate utilization-related uncharacterized protein